MAASATAACDRAGPLRPHRHRQLRFRRRRLYRLGDRPSLSRRTGTFADVKIDAADMTATPGPLFALALASISLIGPLAVHLFMPVIPAVKAALGLSDALAQLTFSIALF